MGEPHHVLCGQCVCCGCGIGHTHTHTRRLTHTLTHTWPPAAAVCPCEQQGATKCQTAVWHLKESCRLYSLPSDASSSSLLWRIDLLMSLQFSLFITRWLLESFFCGFWCLLRVSCFCTFIHEQCSVFNVKSLKILTCQENTQLLYYCTGFLPTVEYIVFYFIHP